MIEITRNTETQASADVTARSRKCFVKRLAIDKYLVTPRPYSKTRRLVIFTLRYGKMFATCEDYYSGESCQANQFKSLCYHVLCALRHADHLARRESQHSQAA